MVMVAKKERKEAPAEGKKNEQKKVEKRVDYSKIASYVIVIAVIAIVVYALYFVFANYSSTSFSVFKSNYMSAPSIAVVIAYANSTQLAYEIPCSEQIIQSVSYARASRGFNTSSMDFFVLNSTDCSYQISLGYPINMRNATAAACRAAFANEPAIYLNYSNSNKTIITPYKLYIYGNSDYMKSCGVAADLR